MYNLKIIKSGNKLEIYKVNNYVINQQGTTEKFYRFVEDTEQQEEKKEQKARNKQTKEDRCKTLTVARNNIIRLIASNPSMNVFLTLTFAQEQDFKESKKSLNIFFTKLRRDYKGLKYLWVLEKGESNTHRWHFHVLTNIPVTIKLNSSKEKKSQEHKQLEQEFKNKYWNYGFVDIRALGEGQENNSNIALYVATYIVKSLGSKDLEGYRVYGYSRKTLDKPLQEKLYTTDSIEDILKQYSKDYQVTYSNSYKIGYSKNGQEHQGTVSYIDLKLKENDEL